LEGSPDEHPIATARPNAVAIVAGKNFIDALHKYELVLSLECEARGNLLKNGLIRCPPADPAPAANVTLSQRTLSTGR
jgi:hypothetical protein